VLSALDGVDDDLAEDDAADERACAEKERAGL
jgi:hypothetical protein